MKVDYVSDVACPWCAVGLNALERAIHNVGADVELRFHPFELNPTMPKEGADTVEYLTKKYGMIPADVARAQSTLHQRGEAVGFTFGTRSRVWNTFDAHRLLFWVGQAPANKGAQLALKQALLRAYHGDGKNVSDPEVLVAAATEAGLDPEEARRVVSSGEFAAEVRVAIDDWHQAGIRSVPSIILNDRHLIQGGQPVEVFERLLRELGATTATA